MLLWMQGICCSCCAATMFASSQRKKNMTKKLLLLCRCLAFPEGEGEGEREQKKKKKESDVRLTARCSAFIVVYHLHLAPLFMYSTFLTHASTITVLPFWCH